MTLGHLLKISLFIALGIFYTPTQGTSTLKNWGTQAYNWIKNNQVNLDAIKNEEQLIAIAKQLPELVYNYKALNAKDVIAKIRENDQALQTLVESFLAFILKLSQSSKFRDRDLEHYSTFPFYPTEQIKHLYTEFNIFSDNKVAEYALPFIKKNFKFVIKHASYTILYSINLSSFEKLAAEFIDNFFYISINIRARWIECTNSSKNMLQNIIHVILERMEDAITNNNLVSFNKYLNLFNYNLRTHYSDINDFNNIEIENFFLKHTEFFTYYFDKLIEIKGLINLKVIFDKLNYSLNKTNIKKHIINDFKQKLTNSIEKKINIPLTPTLRHYINIVQDPELTTSYFYNKSTLNVFLKKFIIKEQEWQSEHYTFVHGQRREYYWPEVLYTYLWSIKNNQSTNNFLFAPIKEPLSEQQRHLEYLYKNFLFSHGRFFSGNYKDETRQLLLFMNYALFANSQNPGSNTALYIWENANVGQVSLSAQEACRMLGCTQVYDRFKREIDALEVEYKSAGKYGNALFIAVPKDKIHKHVFAAKPGGAKIGVEMEDGNQIDDIKEIMETLLHNPEKLKDSDRIEFCLIMTQKKGGLDPRSGIKIIPIVTGDEQKLKELRCTP